MGRFTTKAMAAPMINGFNMLIKLDIIPNKLVNQIYVQPFWKIYEEELLGFCEEDKRYAIKLLEYIEKKKKVCKNA